MDESRWSRIGELFDAIVDIAPEEQEAYLRRKCDDEALILEVLSLVAEDHDTINILEAVRLDAANLVDELWAVGRRVGPYTIVRRIGEGGMGSVFLAERADGEFEQQVALKLVRPERSTEDFVRRFRAERQILARLQHPNIARLLDGGVTESGQLFFAMEYIDGDPIDVYCDQKRLSIDERLDLFGTACRAVHYAHQNLVVHRDLKPQNILVDRHGNVKLLDFGIAKLLEEESELPMTGGALMTPEYASPEQVCGQPPSTSTDLYSLGVILYELLSGSRPYELTSNAPGQVARVVLTSKVISPSTVVRSTRDDRAAVEHLSRARRTVPERLERRLSGDLDMICLKALRKEPDQRYDSASDFAEDLALHGRGLPVTARPYTATYRLQKFVRRHRTGVIAAACVLIATAGMASYYTLQLREERNRAQLAALKAERVADFLKSIFEVADPTVAQGETVTARELLDDGARRIEQGLSDVPEIQSDMMGVIGDVYMGLGLYGATDTLYADALQRIRNVYPDGRSEKLAEALNRFAVLRRLQGQYSEAEQFAREAMEVWEAIGGMETPAGASTMNSLAEALRVQGRYNEAETYYRRALDVRRRLLGEEHRDIADNLNNLSLLLQAKGDLKGAERMQRDALAMRRDLFGERHPDVSNSLNNLGVVLRAAGEYERAESLLVYGLSLRHEVLGEDEPRTVNTLKNLGILYSEMGSYPAAERTLREAIMRFRRRFLDEHPQVTSTTRYLARALQMQGRYGEARDLYEGVLEISRRKLGERHPETASAISDLAGVLPFLQEYEKAERLDREALEIRREVFGSDHSVVATSLNQLAALLAEQGRHDEAEPLRREAVRIQSTIPGSER